MANVKEFIEYCRDILDCVSGQKPMWVKYVLNFQRIFEESPEKFNKVFQKFLDLYRVNLEAPLFVNTVINHGWLKITSDDWSSKGCRGVVIYLNPDSEKLQNYCLPVSDIYALCLKYYTSNTNVKNVQYELVPITFLHKLFKCLYEIEPTNMKLKNNLQNIQTVFDDFYADEAPEAPVSSELPMKDLLNSVKGMINGDMNGIKDLMSSMNLPPEILAFASTIPMMIQGMKDKVDAGESIQDTMSSMPILGDLMKNDSVKDLLDMGKEFMDNPDMKANLKALQEKLGDDPLAQLLAPEHKPSTPELLQITEGNPAAQE